MTHHIVARCRRKCDGMSPISTLPNEMKPAHHRLLHDTRRALRLPLLPQAHQNVTSQLVPFALANAFAGFASVARVRYREPCLSDAVMFSSATPGASAASLLTHPRDRLVAYHEQVERDNDGDVVDTSSQKKVDLVIHRLSDTECSAAVTFLHEDHTLGNALRHLMTLHPNVAAVGYSIPHPLEPKMVLQLQTTATPSAAGHPSDVVADSLRLLADVCDGWCDAFDHAVESSHHH